MAKTPPTEGAAVPSTAQTSSADFAELARSCYPLLWGIAMGMTGNRADAEDVVQESLLIGFRKRESYTPGTRFEAWMATIVRNVANNTRRKKTRQRGEPLFETEAKTGPAKPANTPEAMAHGAFDADANQFDDKLAEALQHLAPDARACLLLRTLHDMDYQSIADLMGMPKNTALSHVHRARQTLRDILSRSTEDAPTATQKGGRP